MSKTFVCRCEDVMLGEIEDAIAAGNRDIESLKRFTGFGTGVCQGKSCVAHVGRLLVEKGRVPAAKVQPFTPRPPVSPIPLSLLAGEDER